MQTVISYVFVVSLGELHDDFFEIMGQTVVTILNSDWCTRKVLVT
jgi:hypothetical protein